jgi:hypothetical protein
MKPFSIFLFLFAGMTNAPLADTAGGWPLALEKWGIAAVCALAALALWKRLDVADKAKIELHREAIDQAKQNSGKIEDLLVKTHESNTRLAASIDAMISEIKSRPCQLPGCNRQTE